MTLAGILSFAGLALVVVAHQGSECPNFHDQCDSWASKGHCQLDPGYMEAVCPRSCNPNCGANPPMAYSTQQTQIFPNPQVLAAEEAAAAGPSLTGIAGDLPPGVTCTNMIAGNTCDIWAISYGECEKYAVFMLKVCTKSCHPACKEPPAEDPPAEEPPPKQAPSAGQGSGPAILDIQPNAKPDGQTIITFRQPGPLLAGPTWQVPAQSGVGQPLQPPPPPPQPEAPEEKEEEDKGPTVEQTPDGRLVINYEKTFSFNGPSWPLPPLGGAAAAAGSSQAQPSQAAASSKPLARPLPEAAPPKAPEAAPEAESESPTGPATTTLACVDTIPACPSWARNNFCDVPAMWWTCAKSCNPGCAAAGEEKVVAEPAYSPNAGSSAQTAGGQKSQNLNFVLPDGRKITLILNRRRRRL